MPKGESVTKQASTTVEVILAVAVFSLLTLGVASGLSYGVQANADLSERTRAYYKADEGLQALRNLRDQAWTNLNDGTYGLTLTNGSWALTSSPDKDGIYTRQIQISSLNPNNVTDTNLKRITTNVTWPKGSLSYTSYLTNWSRVINNNSWARPALSASLDLAGIVDAIEIQVQGNYVYLLRNDVSNNFVVINVANPAAPSITAILTLSGNPTDLVISGTTAYVSSRNNNQELQIVNIANPATPVMIGSYNAPGNADALGVAMANNRAYLARANSASPEFIVVDVTIAAVPVALGTLDLPASHNAVVVQGNYAYLAADQNNEELQIIDISNPLAPVRRGGLDLPGNDDALTLAVYQNTALLGRTNGLLHTINIATPTAPTQLGSINLGGAVNDIVYNNSTSLAFVVTNNPSSDFQILNLANLSSPVMFGSYNTTEIVNAIAYDTARDRAYLVSIADNQEFLTFSPGQ